jgi:hypothetical protein
MVHPVTLLTNIIRKAMFGGAFGSSTPKIGITF